MPPMPPRPTSIPSSLAGSSGRRPSRSAASSTPRRRRCPATRAGATVTPIADGYAAALTAFDHGFFNRAVGMGFERPVTEDDVEAASRFFLDLDRTQSLIQLAPALVTPAVEGWLTARGYRPGRRWVKLWHTLEAVHAAPTTIRIERIDASRADAFTNVALAAFELPPASDPVARGAIGRTGWTHYIGYDGDAPVSVAAMYVTDGVAWLGFGATLEAARGRGGQSAMFAARLRDARDLGCRWAITETGEETEEEPVNPSYRNMLRAGFKLAYARRNWVRVPAS